MAITDKRIYSPRQSMVMKAGKSLGEAILYKVISILLAGIIWHILSLRLNSDLLLPSPITTLRALGGAITDTTVLTNIYITMIRVFKGFGVSVIIGIPLGFIMGFSKVANNILGTLVDSIRQVPIMAWVPLTIIWLGLGDGPTIFLIAMSGIFPLILNTMTGVQNISEDYYYAAKTMGASRWSIFKDVILPATLPDIMVGARLAMSLGWMSVICAEFIATSQGFGYSLVQAQNFMKTDLLLALMLISAIIGFVIDRGLKLINRLVNKWKFIN